MTEDAFRLEVRAFIERNAPRHPRRAGVRSPETAEELAELQTWTAALYERRYVGGGWPVRFGGCDDHDPARDIVVAEELARAHAPSPPGAGALVAAALLRDGSDEQRARHLPAIRAGRELWCQLFSEPDAGSDLASMRTTAVRDGDGWRVTGQKVWTTHGHWADYGYLLARTDPAAPKHAGISAFILDMRSPGVAVRPLREMTGTSDFNEVFLDDVHVPDGALIGQPGRGWEVANASLGEERSGVGALAVRLRLQWRELAQLVRRGGRGSDPVVRQRVADLYVRTEVCAFLVRAGIDRALRGRSLPADAPLAKLSFSETNLALATCGVDVQGPSGTLAGGPWQDELLYARAYTIAGGSSEIMRNLLGERVLGLPREPR